MISAHGSEYSRTEAYGTETTLSQFRRRPDMTSPAELRAAGACRGCVSLSANGGTPRQRPAPRYTAPRARDDVRVTCETALRSLAALCFVSDVTGCFTQHSQNTYVGRIFRELSQQRDWLPPARRMKWGMRR